MQGGCCGRLLGEAVVPEAGVGGGPGRGMVAGKGWCPRAPPLGAEDWSGLWGVFQSSRDCRGAGPQPHTLACLQRGRRVRGGPLLQRARVSRWLCVLAAAGHLPLLLPRLCHLLPLRLAELLPYLPVRRPAHGGGGFSERIKEGSWPGGDLRLPARGGEPGSTSLGPRHLEMPTTLPAKPQTPHSFSFTASVSPQNVDPLGTGASVEGGDCFIHHSPQRLVHSKHST